MLEHSKFGGVLPSLAAKLHVKNIYKIIKYAFEKSGKNASEIDYIAYTSEPGLVICLQVGKIIAETIGLFLNIPVVACNHLLGHAYSSLINYNEEDKQWNFPALALIISGGHTQFWEIKSHDEFTIVGETLDDAIGECLDKTAVIIGKKYPGGAIIEEIAKSGKDTYELPFPKNDNSLDFSFSGLKSEVKRIVLREDKRLNIQNLCTSLQNKLSVILAKKTLLALKQLRPKTFVVGGGVIANKFFRHSLKKVVNDFDKRIDFLIPDDNYCGDNAAMIGIAAYYKLRKTN